MTNPDYAANMRWMGFGVKSGGQLLIGGVESTTALMINLGNAENFELQIVSSRWGLGLGGSGGLVAVLAFGVLEPYDLHKQPVNDWGVNIAFTEKLISKSTLQTLVFAKRFADIYKRGTAVMGYRAVKQAFKDVDFLQSLRNGFHTFFAGMESSKKSGIIVMDIPMAGVGLELSAFLTRGTMYVTHSSDWEGDQ